MTKKNFGRQRRRLYISLNLINYHYNIMVNEMKPNKNLISLKSQPLYGQFWIMDDLRHLKLTKCK